MATINELNLIKSGTLSDKQKSQLKKTLSERRRKLAAAMKTVDQGLKALGKKAKAKKRRAKR